MHCLLLLIMLISFNETFFVLEIRATAGDRLTEQVLSRPPSNMCNLCMLHRVSAGYWCWDEKLRKRKKI